MTDRTYGIKLTADASGVKAAMADVKASTESAGASLKKLEAGGAAASKTLGQTTLSAKQLEQAVRGVPAQLTDIFVSLQAGQNPLQVFLQQGGQLRDMFGGIGPAARAVGGQLLALVNPYTISAAAVATLTAAYLAGQKEASEFAKAIILSGNAAGTSVSQLQSIAVEVANATGATRGAAAEALTALVSTGKVAAGSLQEAAAATLALARVTDVSVADIASQYAALGKAPVAASQKLHESLRFLTPEILAQARALEEQGRVAEAGAVVQAAYAKAQQQAAADIKASLPPVILAMQAVGQAAKDMWDRILNVGRESSIEEQIAEVEGVIQGLRDGSEVGNIAVAQQRLAALQAALQAEQAITAENKRQAEITDAALKFTERSSTAADASAAKLTRTLADLRASYVATLEDIRQRSGTDPLNTAQGIAATEKYRAKLQELGTELNKAAIAAGDKRLKELGTAFAEGEKKAAALKAEIANLNAEIGKISGGQGDFAQKAQARRDKSLTPEQADNKNARAAQDAIDEARRVATFAQNAAIDGRAQAAEDHAAQAARLIEQAAKAADQIQDDDLAARLFDQLDAAQRRSLEAQRTVAQQAQADVEANNALIGQRISELEARLAALKEGATVQVTADTAAAQSQVAALQNAVAALPAEKTIILNVVRKDSGGTAGVPIDPDLPARAHGGPLPGQAPHDRADNQLYWGTPGEWVIQRPAVRHYGQDFLHRLNSMQLPRYAHGGAIAGLQVPSVADRLPLGAMLAALETGGSAGGGLKPALFNFPGFGQVPVHLDPQTEAQLEKLIDRRFGRAALSAGRRR